MYTIVDFPEVGKTHGKFQADTMAGAARKAFFHLSKHYNFHDGSDGERYLVFQIKKLGDKPHTRTYIGTWIDLFNPVEIVEDVPAMKKRGGKYIKERAIVTLWKPEWESVFLREE